MTSSTLFSALSSLSLSLSRINSAEIGRTMRRDSQHFAFRSLGCFDFPPISIMIAAYSPRSYRWRRSAFPVVHLCCSLTDRLGPRQPRKPRKAATCQSGYPVTGAPFENDSSPFKRVKSLQNRFAAPEIAFSSSRFEPEIASLHGAIWKVSLFKNSSRLQALNFTGSPIPERLPGTSRRFTHCDSIIIRSF